MKSKRREVIRTVHRLQPNEELFLAIGKAVIRVEIVKLNTTVTTTPEKPSVTLKS